MTKKLLLILPIFPKSTSDDTIVPFITQFIDYFSAKNPTIEIHVLSLNYPFSKSTYNYKNLQVHALGNGFKKDVFFIFKIIKNLIKAIKLHKKYQFDGVLSFWYGQTAIIGKVLHFLFKVPHYVWMHGQDVKPTNGYLKWFPPNPEQLIMVGENHKKILYDSHKISAKHIANVAVNPETFPKLNTKKRNIDIIGVGNLGKLKNYDLFIDIILNLKEEHPDIKAIICGDGTERKKLENKIKSLDLSKNITLLGYVSNIEVRNLMNYSKIMLHTSTFEGNSFAIQEALFSGCKVISTINCFEKEVSHFYHRKKLKSIVLESNNQLENLSKTEQIVAYDIAKTSDTIYGLFYDFNDVNAV